MLQLKTSWSCLGHLFLSHFSYHQVDKVQFKALRFIFDDFNSLHSDLWVKADRPVLYEERLKAVVAEVFKLYSNCSPLYTGFLIKKYDRPFCGRRLKPLELPAFSTSQYHNGKICFKSQARHAME